MPSAALCWRVSIISAGHQQSERGLARHAGTTRHLATLRLDSAARSTVQRPWPPRALSRAGGVARRRQSPAADFARGAQAYGRCCTVAPRKLPTGVVTESGSGSAPLPHLCLQTVDCLVLYFADRPA